MIVGIVGSRHFGDSAEFLRLMESMLPSGVTEIVSGAAAGVDTLAAWYANGRGIPFRDFPAGKEVGSFTERAHARNQKIADAVDVLIAIPCRHSKGTFDTMRRFEKTGKGAPLLRTVSCDASIMRVPISSQGKPKQTAQQQPNNVAR